MALGSDTDHMTALIRARRVLAVTTGLVAAGALTGALCGVLALTPLLIANWLRTTPEMHFTPATVLALWGVRAGATLGAVLGPTLAWGLLRRVPLWRVVTWTAVGTVLGSLAGWAAAGTALVPSGPAVGVGALLGFLGGGLALRLRSGSARGPATAKPLPNVRWS